MTTITKINPLDSLIEMTGAEKEILQRLKDNFHPAKELTNENERTDPGIIKQDYSNVCYYNVSLDIKLRAELSEKGIRGNYGTMLALPGTSDKRRFLIPALFSGLTGTDPTKTGQKLTKNELKVLPAIIALLTNVGQFIGFVKMVINAIAETWNVLSKLITEPANGTAKDTVANSFKGDTFLESKKTEIKSQDPTNSIDPKKPSEIVQTKPPVRVKSKVGNQEYDLLEDASGEKGFSIYQQTSDNKWYFVTGSGWEKNLIVATPGSYGIPVLNDAVNIYIKYNAGSLPQAQTGNVWGRFYLYVED